MKRSEAMTKLNRIDQQMVEEVLPTGTTSGNNPYDYGKVEAKRIEKKLYTQAEFDDAVKTENEACALDCDDIADELDYGEGFHAAIRCERKIRARIK